MSRPSEPPSVPAPAPAPPPRVPTFARGYPPHDQLDALVRAFEDGDYRTVRAGATALAAATEDATLRAAARDLAQRTQPDPMAKWLFAAAALLMVGLFGYWVMHDGPDPHAPTPPPTIEYVK